MKPYVPPSWASSIRGAPQFFVPLVHGPTPVEKISFRISGDTFSCQVKRDDLTGAGAESGNKLRKLEFVMPEVLAHEHDAVLSIGGTQSNSCRAVSAVCARLGVQCFHVLRKDAYFSEQLRGNRLLMNLLGTKTFLIDKKTYSLGQARLLEMCRDHVVATKQAQNPYMLPVGCSTFSSVFGYIECVREIEAQVARGEMERPARIFFSSGSGGTAAGLALGVHLSSLRGIPVVGYIACDSPSYFHAHVQDIIDQAGLDLRSEQLIQFKSHAKGVGYAVTSEEETQFIRQVARSSGLLLDPTYTGKAMRGWVTDPDLAEHDCSSLFIHTGGLSSIDSVSELLSDDTLIENLPLE